MTEALTTTAPQSAMSLYAKDQIDVLKQTIARGASDAQLAMFLELCRARKLDPFAKHLYWTTNGIYGGIDGFRAIADRTGCYAPGPTAYDLDPKTGALAAAHVTVHKFVQGKWFDVTESAYMAEYAQGTPNWKTKPRVMLAKCAEARALRRAFPEDMGGVYEAAEMESEPAPVVAPPVAAPTAPAPAPVAAKPAPEKPAESRVVEATVVKPSLDEARKAAAESPEGVAIAQLIANAKTPGDLGNVAPKATAALKQKLITRAQFDALAALKNARAAEMA